MFLQAHQEALYLAEVFHNILFKFSDVIDHLRSHSGTVGDIETTIPPASTQQVRSVPRKASFPDWVICFIYIWKW